MMNTLPRFSLNPLLNGALVQQERRVLIRASPGLNPLLNGALVQPLERFRVKLYDVSIPF